MTLKRTALYEAHLALNARMVDFGGWDMPVQYTGIIEEHLTVRNAVGLFDISHMGQVRISGAKASEFLNHLLSNNTAKVHLGHGQYSLMCNPQGGVMDDLIFYQIGPDVFWMIINASRIDSDLAWIKARLNEFAGKSEVKIDFQGQKQAAIAIQGPKSRELAMQVFTPKKGSLPAVEINLLKKNQIAEFEACGRSVLLACTGYTGEDGFEVFLPADIASSVWQKLLAAGQSLGVKPAGLGARDTLRTEAGYPLYGHELDEQTTPIEAGLQRFIDLTKPFIGCEALQKQAAKGAEKKSIAFKMPPKSAPPRPHYLIKNLNNPTETIGIVSSGTQSPSLSVGIGMGFVKIPFAAVGGSVGIEVRGNIVPAQIVKKPIYSK